MPGIGDVIGDIFPGPEKLIQSVGSAAKSIGNVVGLAGGVKSLVDGGPDVPNLVGPNGLATPISSFTSPTLSFTNSGGNVSAGFSQPLADTLGLLDAKTLAYLNQLGEVGNQLQPLFGNASQAVRQVFANARSRLADARVAATSDLRGNLEKRRILGSSFANDSISRQDAEYAKAENELSASEANALAQTSLQELDAKVKLINNAAALDTGNMMQHINALNLATDQSRALATGTQAVMGQLAGIQAQLASQIGIADQQGAGRLFGSSLFNIGNSNPLGGDSGTTQKTPAQLAAEFGAPPGLNPGGQSGAIIPAGVPVA